MTDLAPEAPGSMDRKDTLDSKPKMDSIIRSNNSKTQHKKELCAVCKQLDLSADRFLIDNNSASPARNIRNFHLPQPDPIQMNDFQLRSRSSKKELDKFRSIIARKETCPFCELVVRSITNNNDDTLKIYEKSDAVCYVNWEIDGRAGPNCRTRRLHLSWKEKYLVDSYLVFVAPSKYTQPNSDAQDVWRDEALFLGRKMCKERGNRARIKSWLDLCCKSHRGRCKESRTVRLNSRFGRMIRQSYFGVIDVRTLQLTSLHYELIEAPDDPSETDFINSYPVVEGESREQMIKHKPYVALSHVWGEANHSTTKLQNVMEHRTHGGLEAKLAKLHEPHVFRDAIDIVRGLGIQYIWIDSLCIVQDSNRSWKLNAGDMDLIYGNAQMTICAADEKNGCSGLVAMHSKENQTPQHISECGSGVDLMVSRPPETSIKTSIWDSRAWTFQERLLSKRCLIFTNDRVYFQCSSTGMSEDIVADKMGAGWSLDLVHDPLQMLRELDLRAFWVYSKFVSLYTARNLTEPGDILAAFNGICNLLRKTMRAPFIFGLPSSHFDMALLWEPKKALKRREKQHPKSSARKEGIDKDFNGMEFPSWAWCGWCGEQMKYQRGMVEGCTDNLHEWLINHTWIYWYIRDGHGNLRPLWDGSQKNEDKSSEKRWTGYKTTSSDGDDGRRQTRTRSRSQTSPSTPGAEEHSEDDQDWEEGPTLVCRRLRSPASKPTREIIVHEKSRHERVPSRLCERIAKAPGSQSDRDEYSRPTPLEIADYQEDPSQQSQPENLTWEDRERIDNDKARSVRRRCDEYGRPPHKKTANYPKVFFRQTLPENPYRVVMDRYSDKSDKVSTYQPILQFWTWHTSLHLKPSDKKESNDDRGLYRYDIADENRDWCGSLLLDPLRIGQKSVAKQEFIAISEAKSFTQEECGVWTYYIDKERERSEWDLYYVLLVERKKACWERVALGKVFQRAFNEAKWKEIILG